jgi:adenylosuccinate synthase
MSVQAIVGANWGDEGKGKITDLRAGEADVVVRFQGGRNAGHTIINDYGKFALHLLPAGVFRPGVVNVLGPGVALDVSFLLEELESLANRGVPTPIVRVSDRAEVVLPYHSLFDRCEEERLGDAKFGSTQMGIAPFYADKYLKLGVQVADLFHEARLRSRVRRALEPRNALLEHLYGKPHLAEDEVTLELLANAERLRPYVCDTTALLHDAIADGKRILLEGQLGALRDPDHGIYPWVTSSSTLAGFGCVGAGVPPYAIQSVLAVAKAYSTCVGAGPFVSEIFGKEAETLRARGGDAGEYGATTGRPRRVGWFDAVATRYGCRVQGATEVALTNLDVLGYLDRIPICVGYEVAGKRTQEFPVPALLDEARPIFETLPGWKCDIRGARSFDDLPPQARDYVFRLEEMIGVPVTWLSVGPRRDEVVSKG